MAEQKWPKVILVPYKLYSVFTYDRELANHPEFLDRQRVSWADEFEERVRQLIMGTSPEEYTVRCPETWWDAFKARWFPAWSRKWFPVRWNVVTIEKRALYPEIPWHGAALQAVPILEKWEHSYIDEGVTDDD